MSLSWEPKRKGAVYCAPACGRGCLYTAYLEAKRKARGLATALGKGWKPRVWENLGWYYSAESACGRFTVHPGGGTCTRYLCFLGDGKTHGGHWVGDGKTPAAAVAASIELMRKELLPYMDLLKPATAKGKR